MAADPNTDPFAAMGGGVYVNGGWVPKDHPLAKQAGAAATPAGQTSIDNGPVQQQIPQTLGGQSKAAQTYSQTPGAAPTQTSTNQGTQDVVRNTYLQQATQGTTIDPNDPNIKAQVDPYAAAQERARRQYVSEAAEKLSSQGLGTSGALQNEARYASERAGQNVGQFASTVVGNELKNRRDEIQNALTNLKGMISNDQAMALQQQLADLDAAIKRESLAQSGTLGSRELDIKDELGTGALNVDLLRALLQNQQFGTSAGIQIGEDELNAWLRSNGL
jgi:hypothetical protein